jgi:hypothetical protein
MSLNKDGYLDLFVFFYEKISSLLKTGGSTT